MVKHYVKDEKGRWTRKTNKPFVIGGLLMVTILGGYGVRMVDAGRVGVSRGHMGSASRGNAGEMQPTKIMQNDCLKTSQGAFDCTTDINAIKKWRAYEESQKKVTFKAFQTRYARADSCHNPKDGKCLTAIGQDTQEGITAACPRNIPLGTKIHIEGIGDRICQDRYSKWVDEKRGMGTVDIFVEDANIHTIPAYRTALVTIIN